MCVAISMSNMNRLCFLLCFCLAILVKESAAGSGKDARKVVASVREHPLFLHKCSAVFLDRFTLLTTGSCLLCSNKCKLFITVLNDRLEQPQNEVYTVEKTAIHPNYDLDPSNYDVGIIKLSQPVHHALKFLLPPYNMNPFEVQSTIFTWTFKPDMRDYHLARTQVKTISNEVCSTYLHRFVPRAELCILGKQALALGPYDLGSPLVSANNYVLGTFVKPGVTDNTKVVTYNSIFPVLPWLNDVLSSNLSPFKSSPKTTKAPSQDETSEQDGF